MQVFVSLLLDSNVNIRCKAAGALQSLAVHPGNQQVLRCTVSLIAAVSKLKLYRRASRAAVPFGSWST